MPAKSKKKDESSEDEEFEVDKILDHKGKGESRMYLVAWVGYPASENSWTEEPNLDSCKSLLDQYWKEKGPDTNGKKKSGSAAPASGAASKKRKSLPNGTSARSQPARKKVKEDSSDGSANGKANIALPKEESDSDEDAAAETDINKYMDQLNWEEAVSQVITVEKDDINGALRLFVTWEDGSRAWVASDLIYTRAPQKVIAFFESHLKFKNSSGN